MSNSGSNFERALAQALEDLGFVETDPACVTVLAKRMLDADGTSDVVELLERELRYVRSHCGNKDAAHLLTGLWRAETHLNPGIVVTVLVPRFPRDKSLLMAYAATDEEGRKWEWLLDVYPHFEFGFERWVRGRGMKRP